MPRTNDALKILDHLTGNDRRLRRRIAKETINVQAARMIYEARKAAGLSQAALASMVGTRQPVIARMENADYAGRTLTMLQRIADALGRRISLAWVETPKRRRAA